MTGHGEKRSRKGEMAIAALLTSKSIAEAAGSVGIGERTLRRWMAEPTFRDRFLEVRQEFVRRAFTNIQAAMPRAVDALVEILGDSVTVPAAVRVAAARLVIEKGLAVFEAEELLARIQKLEAESQALGERDGSGLSRGRALR